MLKIVKIDTPLTFLIFKAYSICTLWLVIIFMNNLFCNYSIFFFKHLEPFKNLKVLISCPSIIEIDTEAAISIEILEFRIFRMLFYVIWPESSLILKNSVTDLWKTLECWSSSCADEPWIFVKILRKLDIHSCNKSGIFIRINFCDIRQSRSQVGWEQSYCNKCSYVWWLKFSLIY